MNLERDMTVFKTKIIIAAVFAAILMFGGSPALFAQVSQLVEEKPILSVRPDGIDFGILRDTEAGVASIEISNRGQGKIKWMVKWADPWLALDKYSGVVEDGTQVVSVTADPRDLPLGRHEAGIVITSSCGIRMIPVSATVLRDNNDTHRPKLEEIRLVSITSTQVGRKIRMSAVGIYSDGSERDITKDIKWISENKRAGYFVDKGLFIGKHKGDVRVFVKKGRVKSPVVTIHIDALDGPLLKVSLPKIRLDHMEKDSIEDISMTLRNAGKGELEWEVISRTPWLVLDEGTSSSDVDGQKADESRLYPTDISTVSDGYHWEADVEENASGRQESGYSSSLRGTGRKTVKIAVDVTGLPEGRYEGAILVRSNGGDAEIIIPVNILSLKSISIVPVSLRMAVNHRMAFRAVGIWSDGSRTDLSGGSDGRWTVSDPPVGYFLRRKPVFVAKRAGRAEIRKVRGGVISNVAIVDVEEDVAGSVLMVSPREVDLGTIGPGESSKGVISLKNVGGGDLIWLVYSMGDWISPYDDTLSGTAGMSARYLRISIESMTEEGVSINGLFPVRVRFETGHNSVSYEKLLPLGSYREELNLLFNGGERTVFLKFEVAEKGSRPCMDVKPLGIDFGSVETGRKSIKRIELRNVGKDVLKWKAMLQGKRKNFRGVALERGRYVSFANESISGKGSYSVPGRLKNALEISGEWSEERGYPYSTGEKDLLRYSFSGSGIVLFLWKDIYGGTLDVFLDNRMIGEIDCASEERKRIEFPVAETLADGEPHLLVLMVRGGTVEVEGVRVYTPGLVEGRKGWIRISPEKGTTTHEVDYINVTASSADLSPGSYSENILFYSGEGVEIVEVSLDVKSDNLPELINIYRYTKGTDSLLSPDVARGDFPLERYRKGELAFRLFRKGTPGTTEFFQWHNPSKGTHFYSYSRSGGKHSLKGYVFDGTVGNIATLKLPRTRDLYRWFNPETGAYFYTTDTKGENREKMGYIYDGVAGYVR
ncbi:MAG: hypothetical protein JRC93_03540 [Deltaproteobacteria bacterium]|nr:hypothetical protein [Deltaproteobacteria bacterium]